LKTYTPATTRERFHHALLINVRNIPALHDLNSKIEAAGIETNVKEISNDSSPFGENFTAEDPDKNKIIFGTSRMLSNAVAVEEYYCDLLLNQPKIFKQAPTEISYISWDEGDELDYSDLDED